MLGIKSSATPNIKMQKAGARRELLLLRFLAASDLGVMQNGSGKTYLAS
jgi:hypothetical protein